GFESGGLAGAHGFAEGYTRIPAVEQQYLHGEMVAMGVISQLMMERDTHEAERVAEFFASVGLPIHLEQLGLSGGDPGIDEVVEGALAFAPIHNLPFAVDANRVKEGLVGANQLGMRVSERLGDAAYRRLHQ
ncbi:MAG: iron-containing alcohol dehydrogenase, partial [Pseudomonadota bacterium]